MLLLTLITGLVMPALRNFSRGRNLGYAASQMTAMANYAHTQSISQGKPYRLNLDVNNGTPYGIPADNPFATNKQGRPEVWAYGLRNPWRFSFDRTTNDLYIADVGQDNYEEVDVQKAGTPGGLNYGWHTMEGLHCYAPNQGCDQTGLVLPVVEYDHSGGNCSITGGYVYRGSAFPHLQGTYFFSDYCSGHVWAMQQGASGWKALQVIQQVGNVSTFGEDEAGELYLADISSGTIYHLVESAS